MSTTIKREAEKGICATSQKAEGAGAQSLWETLSDKAAAQEKPKPVPSAWTAMGLSSTGWCHSARQEEPVPQAGQTQLYPNGPGLQH